MLKLIVLFSLAVISHQAPVGYEIGTDDTAPSNQFAPLADFVKWIMPSPETVRVYTGDFVSRKRSEFENIVKNARAQLRQSVDEAMNEKNPEALYDARYQAALLEDTVQLLAKKQENFANSNGQNDASFDVPAA